MRHCIIIGAMKSGTTTVHNYLARVESICECVVKEPQYFSENQADRIKVKKYRDLWPNYNPKIHKYVMEASTTYTKYPDEPNVPHNMFKKGLKAKFIYIVRNPFDRILSHFHNRTPGVPDHPDDFPLTTNRFIITSKYYMQLMRFRKYFPKEDFLVLEFDELVSDPETFFNRIFDFLKLDDRFIYDQYKIFNVSEKRRIMTDEEWEKIYKILEIDMKGLQNYYGVDVSKWGF